MKLALLGLSYTSLQKYVFFTYTFVLNLRYFCENIMALGTRNRESWVLLLIGFTILK
jgi:hypothetical protein